MLIYCRHCGTDSEVDPEDEEPRCELCDGYLEDRVDEEEE